MSENKLRVGGIIPLSTVDFPDQLSCVLFCQGCPWRCSYCHNTHLLAASADDAILWPQIEQFLATRVGLLDAVVFSGGEPTAQVAIIDAAQRVREMGFNVGLHTGGAYAERLEELLPHCDWVALDVKTTPYAYADLTGAGNAAQNVWQSLAALINSGVRYEVRTTVDWDLLPPKQLLLLATELQQRGVTDYAIQFCRQPQHDFSTFDHQQVHFIRQQIATKFKRFALRDSANSFSCQHP